MLTIAAADESRAAGLAAQNGLSGAVSGWIALENGKEAGWLLTAPEGDRLLLLAAEAADGPVLEGLVRAALFAALGRGMREASCRAPALFSLLERLRFTRDGEGWGCSLAEFCHRPCPGPQR